LKNHYEEYSEVLSDVDGSNAKSDLSEKLLLLSKLI
jgi:hypothetical protein